MLGNLIIEIKKSKFSQGKIAEYLGISANSMSKKVTGKWDFTASEMFAIQKEFFPDKSLEYLFAKQ